MLIHGTGPSLISGTPSQSQGALVAAVNQLNQNVNQLSE